MNIDKSVIEAISEKLRQSGALLKYSGKGDPPEYETAYAVAEIVQSASKLLDEIFPKLLSARDPEECFKALEDFREEIRHISYHIRDSEYLSVVLGTI